MKEKIHIMLASRPKMLSEVIKSMIEHQSDMAVIGEVFDPIELLSMPKLSQVDVVIIAPMKVEQEPKICVHLLKKQPYLKIIVLSEETDAGYLYQFDAPAIRIDEPTEQAVFGAIRKSMLKSKL